MEDIAGNQLLKIYVKSVQDKVEDEALFICYCSWYDSERFKYFDYINHELPKELGHS